MTDEVFPNGNRRDKRIKQLDLTPQRDDPARFENLLDAEEIEQLRADARAAVLAEQKKRKSDALYAQFLDEERQQVDPAKQLLTIFVQLAPTAPYIMLDGRQFLNNTVYQVPEDVFSVLMEQITRGWAHEQEADVRSGPRNRRAQPPAGMGYGNFLDNRMPRGVRASAAELAAITTEMQRMMVG